jgi:sodium transport system ATP-binding protein
VIEIDALHKAFGELIALDSVSFKAEDGRITGLLGPNGAGKSTTLRILYTALRPDRGSAVVDEFDAVREPLAVRRHLGVLPHGSGLYARLTARENVEYFGRLHGLRGAALADRVRFLDELLGLGDVLERRAKELSQGQRVRVALARALVHWPANVVLDEPTNGLDVPATRSLRALIRRLRDEGRCVLFSSHVMQEVAALCDEVVILARGRVVAQGTPDGIRQSMGQGDLEDAFVSAIGPRPAGA